MIQDKNEFNKKNKRNRSTDFINERDQNVSFQINHFGDVSENAEEEISDSSLEKQ